MAIAVFVIYEAGKLRVRIFLYQPDQSFNFGMVGGYASSTSGALIIASISASAMVAALNF
jgi:hypothetical protein